MSKGRVIDTAWITLQMFSSHPSQSPAMTPIPLSELRPCQMSDVIFPASQCKMELFRADGALASAAWSLTVKLEDSFYGDRI